jgi:polysaccharide export outer membrane protein
MGILIKRGNVRHIEILIITIGLFVMPSLVQADSSETADALNTTESAQALMHPNAENVQDGNNNFDSSNYTLGPEDVVEISVMHHPDFSGIYPIDLEGKIQYKFVGDINVIGMTKRELEEKIKTTISAYVASPEVNVMIVDFKSKAFYVLGEVGSPGKYNMRSESITVSEAVIMAGLPTDGAAMRKTRIITPGINGSRIKKINLYSLLYGGDLKENVSLKPGDTLYVPAAVTESAGDMQDGNNNFDPLEYTLGPEDVVEISVMHHPDFSGIYPIDLEGKIQYKFVGDINVIGMTKRELEEKIKTTISAYVASPEVNVMIVDFKSKAFYVLGEVGSPGKYNMRSESITVSEAVIMAGLPTDGAAMRKTRIITPGINGSRIKKINLYSLLYGGDLKENVSLKPGDTLYVPSTVMAKLIRVISPVSTTVGLAAGPPSTIGNSKAGISNLVK